jgi:hypothetical protein
MRSAKISLPIAAATLLAAPHLARAGDASAAAAAQALFDEGKDLSRDGHYEEACPKFEESQRLDPGIGTQFHLADCWQHVGRTASAWALFRDVESQAHGMAQRARERVARDRASALQPFLSKLVIIVHDDGISVPMDVRRDGTPVGRDQWGIALPIDPGPHLVTMTATNKRPWQARVEAGANGKTVTVDLPALAELPDVEQQPAPGVAGSAAPAPPRQASPPAERPRAGAEGVTSEMPPNTGEPVIENRGNAQRAVGWFFVGTGTAALAASAYFAGKWIADRSLQSDHCSHGACDPAGLGYNDDARKQATTAEVALAAGATAFIVGALFVTTAPSPRIVVKNVATLDVAPVAGPAQGGVTIHGAW